VQQAQKKNTTHRSSTSIVVFIVLTCNVGQTMTGSPQTRSAGQVRKSPEGNKVGQKTGKVRKSTSARARRSLNGKLTGNRIATKPAPKVDAVSDDVDSNDEVEEVDNNRDQQRQKTKVSSNVDVDNVLELPMRKKIVSSRNFTVKRKKRPGKARKPVRAPELHESSSSYEDETYPSNEYDRKFFAGRVVQKPTIAAAVEALDDDDDDDDDYADKKEAEGADEEQDDYATATTHEETPLI
jgi:hypothetical protein